MFIDYCTPQEIGVLGEWIAMRWLIACGYLVEAAHSFDLTAGSPDTKQVHKIEVKTARMSADGTYQFVLFKLGHTDHQRADYIVLLCLTPDGEVVPFVIPASATALMTKITIPTDPRTYRGQWQLYRQQTGMLVLK